MNKSTRESKGDTLYVPMKSVTSSVNDVEYECLIIDSLTTNSRCRLRRIEM